MTCRQPPYLLPYHEHPGLKYLMRREQVSQEEIGLFVAGRELKLDELVHGVFHYFWYACPSLLVKIQNILRIDREDHWCLYRSGNSVVTRYSLFTNSGTVEICFSDMEITARVAKRMMHRWKPTPKDFEKLKPNRKVTVYSEVFPDDAQLTYHGLNSLIWLHAYLWVRRNNRSSLPKL